MIDISMKTALYLYIICFAFGAFFMTILYYFIDKKENNYLHFFLFFVFSLMGAILLTFQDTLGAFFGGILANSLIVIGYLMLIYGVQKVYKLKYRIVIYFAFYFLFLIIDIYFMYVNDNIFARVYLINFTSIAILGYGLYMFVKQHNDLKGFNIMALAMLGIVIMALLRTVNFMINNETSNQLLLFKYDPFFIVLVGIANIFVIPGILSIVKSQKEKALYESEARLNKSQLIANVGSWELDIKTNKVWGSDEAYNIYEVKQKSNFFDFTEALSMISIEDKKIANEALKNLIANEEEYNITYTLNAPSGKKIINSHAEVTYDSKGNPSKVLGVIRDITKIKEYEKALIEMSIKDDLTGLYNRRYYEEKARYYDELRIFPLTLIMADVNGLKLVNDTFGHQTGDELLKKNAELLKTIFPDNADICRIGGDEFIIILPGKNEEYAEKLVLKVKEKAEKIIIQGTQLSISFGIATTLYGKTGMSDLFRTAEDDMYQAKLVEVPSMHYAQMDKIMSTLSEKDPYVEKHVEQVSKISEEIAKEMKLSQTEINAVKAAGLLHDIGKIIIPTEILVKPDKLTNDEYEIVKTHSQIGYRILNSSSNTKSIAEIVLYHHERWDGLGYPKGLSKTEIPLLSRIINVADAFDAMTSYRSYSKTKTKKEALEELILCRGTQFDPEIIDVFVKNFIKITSLEG